MQQNFTCTLDDLKVFGQRCREDRLLNIVEEAHNKTEEVLNGPSGNSQAVFACTWVAHLEMSHTLTNKQCTTLSSIVTELERTYNCSHGM